MGQRIIDTIEKVVLANQAQRAILDKDIPASCNVIITCTMTKGTCTAIKVETESKKK